MRASVTENPHAYGVERRLWYALDEHALPGIVPDPSPYPLCGVAILTHRDEYPSIERIALDDALHAVVQRSYTGANDMAQLAELRMLLARTPCFNVIVGEPDRTAYLLTQRIERCA
jgi:hypothetical protein